jgi:Thermolysin metallopeptidase, alpha-helical domain
MQNLAHISLLALTLCLLVSACRGDKEEDVERKRIIYGGQWGNAWHVHGGGASPRQVERNDHRQTLMDSLRQFLIDHEQYVGAYRVGIDKYVVDANSVRAIDSNERVVVARQWLRCEEDERFLPLFGKSIKVTYNADSNEVISITGHFYDALERVSCDASNSNAAAERSFVLFADARERRVRLASLEFDGDAGRVIDSASGRVLDGFGVAPTLLERRVYEGAVGDDGDETLVWREGDALPTGDVEVDRSARSMDVSYALHASLFGVDSYDNAGSPLRTVVRARGTGIAKLCPVNAAYDQVELTVVACSGMAMSPDVLLHESAHLFSQNSGVDFLVQRESGALEEAIADAFAEASQILFADELLPEASDDVRRRYETRRAADHRCLADFSTASSVRWIAGDQLTFLASQVPEGLRDIFHPSCAEQPDTVAAIQCLGGDEVPAPANDFGFVHGNSGPPAAAFAWLVDGGTFVGVDAGDGIGVARALNIYARALTRHHTQTSTFAEHALALTLACDELVGEPLVDPKNGNEASERIDSDHCAVLDIVLDAIGLPTPACDGDPAPPTPVTIVRAVFPPAVQRNAATRVRVWVNTLAMLADRVYCFFGDLPARLGTFVITEQQTLVECTTPELGSAQTLSVRVSIDASAPSADSAPLAFYEPFSVSGIEPSTGGEFETTVITVRGANFATFQGCDLSKPRDYNGDVIDCLACLFFRPDLFDSTAPVAATLVDSTTATCKVPPRASMPGPPVTMGFAFTLNDVIYLEPSGGQFTYELAPATTTPIADDADDSDSDSASSLHLSLLSLLLLLLLLLTFIS